MMSHEPQSIVHQVIRLTRKSTKVLSRLSSHSRGSSSSIGSCDSCVTMGSRDLNPASQDTNTKDAPSTKEDPKETRGTIIGAQIHVDDLPPSTSRRQLTTRCSFLFAEPGPAKEATISDDESTASTNSSSSSSPLPETTKKVSSCHADYRTITQNDLFLECFEKNGSFSIIHFYENEGDEPSIVSKMLDRHLEDLAMMHTEIKFLRIKGTSAPFFTAKLNLKTFPCVLALRNGDMCNQLVDFERFGLFASANEEWDEKFLNRWIIEATRIKD